MTDGQGARTRRETVDSQRSLYRTFAYIGLTSRSSTWSIRGYLLLVRANLRRRTGPGECSHEGIDVPQDERRWKLKNLSCGVVCRCREERSDGMQSIWKDNLSLGIRQILGLETKTDSFPDDTIVSVHMPVTNRVDDRTVVFISAQILHVEQVFLTSSAMFALFRWLKTTAHFYCTVNCHNHDNAEVNLFIATYSKTWISEGNIYIYIYIYIYILTVLVGLNNYPIQVTI